MYSRQITGVQPDEAYPYEDKCVNEEKCRRISNIHRIPPGLQKTYIQMMATYDTSHYTSKQSDASCAACKTPNSSYQHVNFRCEELKPDISQEQRDLLLTLVRKQIPRQNNEKHKEETDKIYAAMFLVKMRYANHA